MKTTKMARVLLLALAFGAAARAFAVPLMDMRADDLLAMEPEARQALHLNPNQQTLWQQADGRSRVILRERRERRERLQQEAAAMLGKPNVELRDLNAKIEAEAGLSAAEDKQLRALWLTMNDALDDQQRRQVAALVADQMMRAADGGDGPRAAHEGREGGEGRGGHRGGARRGMGMPGS